MLRAVYRRSMYLAGVVVALATMVGCDSVFDLARTPDAPIVHPSNYLQVSAGRDYTCGIRQDATLWCWGDNAFGQISPSVPGEAPSPVQIGDTTWSLVAAGSSHTCAIDSATHLWCWGDNTAGQCGTAFSFNAPPTDVGAGYVDVTTGGEHTCAIDTDARLWCWGRSNFGQLGVWFNSEPQRARAEVTGHAWAHVVAGQGHTCALTTDGDLYCWGGHYFGETMAGVPASGNPDATWATPVAQEPGTRWISIAAGDQHTCGVRADGIARCWGRNASGQLGGSTPIPLGVTTVSPIDPGHVWKQIAANRQRTCAVRDDDALWCWGSNAQDGLGYADDANDLERTQVRITAGAEAWASISLGGGHLCGIATDRQLSCAGNNGYGAIGDGTGGGHRTPRPLGGTWKKVSLGARFACGVTPGDAIQCWGQDGYGELAMSSGLSRQAPVDVLLGTDVSAGAQHACAIASDGTVTCWGNNDRMQSGQPTGALVITPTTIASTLTPTSLGVGVHACAISSSQAWCWGPGDKGQLDGQPRSAQANAVNVNGSYMQVTAGGLHSCGITTTRQLFCWGDNAHGQLGKPGSGLVQVSAMTWLEVAAGDAHTCAIDTAHELYCWGLNYDGQLGDGSNTMRTTPMHIGSDHWLRVATGEHHTCAIRDDGTVWCWGRNLRGELGDDTLVPRTSPGLVKLGSGARPLVDVMAGSDSSCAIDDLGAVVCWGGNGSGQLGDASAWSAEWRVIP